MQYGESVAAASKTLSVLGLTLLNWAKTHLARVTRRCVEQSGDCWANGDQWTQSRTGPYKNGAEHSKKSDSAYDVRGLEIKYAFIGSWRRVWPVSAWCRVSQVSTASHYAHLWYAVPVAAPEQRSASWRTCSACGYPCIWRELVARSGQG